jgi:hypothetical protein
VSLTIEVAEDSYPPRTVAIGGPAEYEPRRSRVVMHETLHYWQQLTHGFLARLAAEEWRRLSAFRKTGHFPPSGPLRRQYVLKHAELGFSVRTLHESLTRGWDIHICNPTQVLRLERESGQFTDEAFWARFEELEASGALDGPGGSYTDLAYELGMEGAGGRYAGPFRYLVQHSSRARAGPVFPLAAHFALQTADPLESYARIAPLLADEARALKPAAIEDLWVSYYDHARQRIGPILDDMGQPYLPGEDVLREELANHPGYRRAIARLERLQRESWRAKPYHLFPPQVPEPIRRRQAADVVLATPGIPEHRALLVAYLPPPLVRFVDGRTWLLGQTFNEEYPDAGIYLGEELEADADSADTIDRAWTEMLNARWRTGALPQNRRSELAGGVSSESR